MHKADKTPEPSMEEILASIRKIIAEEPIGSRPERASQDDEGNPPLPAGDVARRADTPTLPMPSRNLDDPDGPPYSVEDALADLMDDSSQRRTGPAADKDDFAKPLGRPSQSEEDSRPSWLFGGQSTSPSPAQQPASASPAPARGQGAGLFGQLGPARENPDRTAAEGGSPATKPAPGPKPVESSALFDRPREAGRPGPADFPTLPKVQSQDVPRPAAPRVPARESGPAAVRADEESALVPPAASSPAAPRPAAAMPMARSPEPAADRALPAATPRREQATEAAGKPEEGPRAVQPQPQAAVRQDQDRPLAAAVTDREHKDGPQRASLKEAAATALQIAGARPDAEKKPEAPSPPQASAQPSVARTLEDTVAELLRPMLREWLDANMPRIVEKALRVELAASAKRPERSDE